MSPSASHLNTRHDNRSCTFQVEYRFLTYPRFLYRFLCSETIYPSHAMHIVACTLPFLPLKSSMCMHSTGTPCTYVQHMYTVRSMYPSVYTCRYNVCMYVCMNLGLNQLYIHLTFLTIDQQRRKHRE